MFISSKYLFWVCGLLRVHFSVSKQSSNDNIKIILAYNFSDMNNQLAALLLSTMAENNISNLSYGWHSCIGSFFFMMGFQLRLKFDVFRKLLVARRGDGFNKQFWHPYHDGGKRRWKTLSFCCHLTPDLLLHLSILKRTPLFAKKSHMIFISLIPSTSMADAHVPFCPACTKQSYERSWLFALVLL